MDRIGFVCLLIGISVTAVRADVVELTSGEKLVGTVVRWEAGKLTFQSEALGEVKIPVEKIQNLQTDEPLTIELRTGEIIERRIERMQEEDLVVSEPGRTGRIAQSELTALNPSPATRWYGAMNLGLTASRGNNTETSGNFGFDATRETKKTDFHTKSRWHSKALYAFARDEVDVDTDGDGAADDTKDKTTVENVTVSSKYDHFLNEKLYGFLSGNWKKDHIADLDRRIIVGVGAGYEWIDGGTYLFTTDAGLALRHERYVTPIETTTSDELSAQLGYTFHWIINSRFRFLHDLTYYPSLQQFSDYFLNSGAEVRLKLNDAWFAGFKTVLDFDATPPEGTESTDMTYLFSLGWSF